MKKNEHAREKTTFREKKCGGKGSEKKRKKNNKVGRKREIRPSLRTQLW